MGVFHMPKMTFWEFWMSFFALFSSTTLEFSQKSPKTPKMTKNTLKITFLGPFLTSKSVQKCQKRVFDILGRSFFVFLAFFDVFAKPVCFQKRQKTSIFVKKHVFSSFLHKKRVFACFTLFWSQFLTPKKC